MVKTITCCKSPEFPPGLRGTIVRPRPGTPAPTNSLCVLAPAQRLSSQVSALESLRVFIGNNLFFTNIPLDFIYLGEKKKGSVICVVCVPSKSRNFFSNQSDKIL